MPLLRLWNQTSKGRRLNIKRVFLFPVIVYAMYILVDRFMPLFLIGFVTWLLHSWIGNKK